MHPHTICVNEFGLYDLILRSRMKKAEHFSIEMLKNISNFQKYMLCIYFFKKISDK